MSYKTYKQLAMMSAMMLAGTDYFDLGNRRVEDKKENPEDKERRERCEKTAIEKAQAKRERKAAKLKLNAREGI